MQMAGRDRPFALYGDDQSMPINVQVFCELDAGRLEAFATVLSELVSLVGPDRVTTLGTIVVVDAANVQEAVSAVIRTIDPSVTYTPNPGYSARGVAVPVEQDSQLISAIVLARELIELLAPPRIHPSETVSTVLEELLHVSVYEAAWRRRGYVHHRGRGLSACDADVLTVVSQMSDEYVVNRRKAMLASTRPMFDHTDGGLSTGELQYGWSVANTVSSGIRQLGSIVRGVSVGGGTAPESWNLAISGLYRGVLEPLARHAAYNEVNPSAESVESLADVPHYRERVSEHWLALHRSLQRMFDSDLADTDLLLPEMSEAVRQILLRFGIEYQQVGSGSCQVRFRDPGGASND